MLFLGLAPLVWAWCRKVPAYWLVAFPLCISMLFTLILIFVPFTSIWLDWQFKYHFAEYAAVIEQVEAGQIQPNARGLAVLPETLRHLSRGGGEIWIDRDHGVTRVFFFTFRGVLDNCSGIMYRSDGARPDRHDFWGDWKQIEALRPNWYFCAST